MAVIPDAHTLLAENLDTLQYLHPIDNRDVILFVYRAGTGAGPHAAVPYRFTAGGLLQRVSNDEFTEVSDFEGSFDNRPGAVFYERRLVVGGGPRRPSLEDGDDQSGSITGSRSPNPRTGKSRYFNLQSYDPPGAEGDATADTAPPVPDGAYNLEINSSLPMQIRWLTTFYNRLMVGTNLGVWLLHGLQPDRPPASNREQGRAGANHVRPVTTSRGIAWVGTDGKTIYLLGKLVARDSWAEPMDLTAYAEHITDAGVREMAWQQTPEERLWVLMNDGTLACLCVHSATGVAGWVRMPTAFPVASIAVQPGYEQADVLWALVRVSDSPRRHALCKLGAVPRMDFASPREIVAETDSRPRHIVVHDRFTAGTPMAVVDRRETPYETFRTEVVVDDDGAYIEAPMPLGTVDVGIPFNANLELLQIPILKGPAHGQFKRVARATVGLHESTGGMIGATADTLKELAPDEPGQERTREIPRVAIDAGGLERPTASLYVRYGGVGRFEITYINAEASGG